MTTTCMFQMLLTTVAKTSRELCNSNRTRFTRHIGLDWAVFYVPTNTV